MSETNDAAPYADGEEVSNDPIVDDARAKETVTNDAVAGETVLPGAGDGNDSPTGGSPGEAQPTYADNDLSADEADLDDSES